MFATICNGLINMGGTPVCIDDEIDVEDYEEMYNNTYYSGDEFSSEENDENKSDMCGW
jgi:hypothetical protein